MYFSFWIYFFFACFLFVVLIVCLGFLRGWWGVGFSFIHSFIHPSIHSSIHSFIYLFIYLFIYDDFNAFLKTVRIIKKVF